MASDWGTIKKACPQCVGDLKWFEFGRDCRGGEESSGVTCTTSKCELTSEQRSAFWQDLRLKKQADWDALCAKDRKV